LTRAADIVNTGLTEMRGATAPRLQLELICARVLLPAASDDERGLLARLDRLERRMAIGGPVAAAPAVQSAPAAPTAPAPSAAPPVPADADPPAAGPGDSPAAEPAQPPPPARPAQQV